MEPVLTKADFVERCKRCRKKFVPRRRQIYCSHSCCNKDTPHPKKDPRVLFWRKIDRKGEQDCWLPKIRPKKKYWVCGGMGAHRFSWVLHFGTIPDKMLVCHTCDCPHCVNPNHLFLGTYLDNNKDMWKKGRGVIRRGV